MLSCADTRILLTLLSNSHTLISHMDGRLSRAELPGHSKGHGDWPEKESTKNTCLAIATSERQMTYVEKHKAKANEALPTKHPAPKARGATKSPPEGRLTGLSANSCGVCLDLRSERPTEKPPTRNGTSNKLGRCYRLEHMLSMPKALGLTLNTK